MDVLVMTAQLLLGLGLLVFVHELGHFLAARAFGIKVEKFYIFFDFWGLKLFSKKVGETEYGLGWFPLGGYVKISGMVDESMDTEQLQAEPQPWEFRSKPAWQRLIVMLGGIIMNIIIGVIIFAGYLLYFKKDFIPPESVKEGIYAYEKAREMGFETGDKVLAINGKKVHRLEEELTGMKIMFGAEVKVDRNGIEKTIDLPDDLFLQVRELKGRFLELHNMPFSIDTAVEGFPAYDAGMRGGDVPLTINGQPVTSYGFFRETVMNSAGKQLIVEVLRNGEATTLNIEANEMGLIGIAPKPETEYPRAAYSLFSAFRFGALEGWETIYYNAKGLGQIFQGKVKASESIQSPIGIAKIYGSVWNWERFWLLTGMISFVLAFMNLLPIPALDGGHVVFLLVEMVRGKPLSDKILEKAQVVGMVLLLILMAFAFGNDIYKSFMN